MRVLKRTADSNVRRDNFLLTAKSYVGYTASADGTNYFSERVGYTSNGTPWDGAFIDVVARESGLPLTSCVYTPTALSRFFSENRVYAKPQRGDIVFFETSTAAREFGPPHVGIVTDVSKFLTDGVFLTIEAQVSSGLPKGNNLPNGVYQRVRAVTEVLAFARPNFHLSPKPELGPTDESPSSPIPVIKTAQVQPTVRHKSVVLLQQALTEVTGISGFQRGTMCPKTKAAYAYFQRGIGQINADGFPEINSLQRLAHESRLFKAEL